MGQIREAIACELRLLQADVRADRRQIDALLADDFVEVGKSGRLSSRAEMIDAMLDDATAQPIRAEDVEGRVLADGVVLVQYTSVTESARARRMSIWVRSSSGWRVTYHQGTLVG